MNQRPTLSGEYWQGELPDTLPCIFGAAANCLNKGYLYTRAEHLKFISIQHILLNTQHLWGPCGAQLAALMGKTKALGISEAVSVRV